MNNNDVSESRDVGTNVATPTSARFTRARSPRSSIAGMPRWVKVAVVLLLLLLVLLFVILHLTGNGMGSHMHMSLIKAGEQSV